ncbi:MAG TPA: hypothetical protein VNA25_07905 [Phycisphaerae bacterium]|nr:hypothetical protein [Phycisphaerae bacterium]
MTPEEAWRTFELAIPERIAPSQVCPKCLRASPSQPVRWMEEELLQMRDEFLRLFREGQQ